MADRAATLSEPMSPERDGPARPATAGHARIDVLDGWRALSIVMVVVGHWLPLGPHVLGLNGGIAAGGMALFFTLSGFLIVRVLIADPAALPFLIRRVFRIVPLAWAAMLILFAAGSGDARDLAANLLFVSNLPPDHLVPGGFHLWSLCVEAQFYLAIAVVVAVAGRRGLWLVPLAAVAVTGARIWAQQPTSIVTWHRVDEILAGGILALLVYRTGFLARIARLPGFVSPLLLALVVFATTPLGGPLAYLRPYLAAAAVGTSMVAMPPVMYRLWTSRAPRYVAEISYAVYVIHGMLTDTWLGSGSTTEKYLKRPLLAAATLILAHLSTRYYEAPMIGLGKRLARAVSRTTDRKPG